MSGCCGQGGYEDVFDARYAQRRARRYRRRGLDPSSRRLVEAVDRDGIVGGSVLEIGGGVGEVQVELLKRGAADATNVELSNAYEAEARRLLDEAGLTERAERRLADVVTAPDEAPVADVVILHRVVCCYPDPVRLLGVAADHARRLLVFSHPRRDLLTRTVLAAENAVLRMSGRQFRVFAHPREQMRSAVEARGLRQIAYDRGVIWQIEVFEC